MSTLLNRFTLLASFAFSAFCLQAVDKKPSGLVTDLIEYRADVAERIRVKPSGLATR